MNFPEGRKAAKDINTQIDKSTEDLKTAFGIVLAKMDNVFSRLVDLSLRAGEKKYEKDQDTEQQSLDGGEGWVGPWTAKYDGTAYYKYTVVSNRVGIYADSQATVEVKITKGSKSGDIIKQSKSVYEYGTNYEKISFNVVKGQTYYFYLGRTSLQVYPTVAHDGVYARIVSANEI